jgi:glucokinase
MTDKGRPIAVGIDFGGTSVKIGVCEGGRVLETLAPIVTVDHRGPDALIEAMAENVRELRQRYPAVSAVGCGVPGLVDFNSGLVHEVTNVAGWLNVPFRERLEEKTGLPAAVDNDANCMAYAEWRYGAGRGFPNIVAVTLGTGIGGALIIDGCLYRGAQFGAGEIGQMSIAYNGKSGFYGNLGAIETYMGHQQITEHAVRRYAEAGQSKSANACSPKQLSEWAGQGDPVATGVWNEVAEWLGTALGSIIWLLNPDAIIVGGGVAQSGELLFKPLAEKVKSMVSPVLWENLKLLPAHFGNEAGIIGSAAQALDMAVGVEQRGD